MIIDDNNPANGDFDDDDSFALENLDTYPGNLATFVDVTPSTSVAEPASSDASAVDAQHAGDIEHDISELPMESHSASATNDDDNSFHADVRALEGDDIFSAESASGAENLHPNDEEIDTDDFVRQLQADLERSKAKKAAHLLQNEAKQEAESVPKVEFTSVEDYPGAEEIDLSSIEAHHPSTYRQMEEAAEAAPPAFEALPEDADSGYSGYAQMAASIPQEAPAAIDETPKQKSEPVLKEKKSRKGLYLLVAASAAILALGFGAYSFYPQLSQMLGTHPAADSAHVEAPSKAEPMAHRPPQKNNHTSVADRVEANRRTDSLRQIAELQKAAEEKAPDVKELPKEIVKAEPPKPIVRELPKKQEVVAAEPKPVVKEPKPVVKEPKPAVKEAKPPTIARNNSAASTSEAKPQVQVYTVQVYSSPSKDDADERLTRLKSRNATNASMSEQTIRGQKWYRVRFGAFASRDEAEAAAKQLGFTQCWIDRVR